MSSDATASKMEKKTNGTTQLGNTISSLKKHKNRLMKERTIVQKELEVAQRKRSRLKSRAILLSTDALVDVLSLRDEAKKTNAASGAAGPGSASKGDGKATDKAKATGTSS